MEEELSILSEDEINSLFDDTEEVQESPPEEKETKEETKENKETTEINVDELFTESESVGSEENIKEKESTTPNKESTSPNNFYSSIATALRDSTFPDLDSNVKDADEFASSFERLLLSRLDERQKRIDEALNNGVEPSAIKQYEDTLLYLNNIKSDELTGENSNSEDLRKRIIFRDLLNKGYSLEEAKEEINEIFESGNDIKRAERALKSNINYFQNEYNRVINDAREQSEREEKDRKELADNLKKSILSDSKAFGDIEVSQVNRQKAYEAISKPVYKDPDTGNYLTAIQKYEKENSLEFLKNLGLLFVLTDNFKNLDNLIKGKVNKESKKALRELENTLNNTSRNSDGSLKFISGVEHDPESSFKGYTLDI